MLIKKLYSYQMIDINDINRIRKTLNEHYFDMLISDIYNLWNKYSNKSSANWLILPEDDNELFDVLLGEFINMSL